MSRLDRYTTTSKKSELYSDFFTNLTPHPATKQLVRKVNEEAVKGAIRNLLLTNKYERPFQPDLGSNIRKLLFEHISPENSNLLKTYVTETIENNEPRCKLINVIVNESEAQQSYFITVLFYIINRTEPVELTVTLYRVR